MTSQIFKTVETVMYGLPLLPVEWISKYKRFKKFILHSFYSTWVKGYLTPTKLITYSKRIKQLCIWPIPLNLVLEVDRLYLPLLLGDGSIIPRVRSLCLGVKIWCFFRIFPSGLWLDFDNSSLISVSNKLWIDKVINTRKKPRLTQRLPHKLTKYSVS